MTRTAAFGRMTAEPVQITKAIYAATTDEARHRLRRLRRQVKHRPMVAVAAAMVIGGVLGALVWRR